MERNNQGFIRLEMILGFILVLSLLGLVTPLYLQHRHKVNYSQLIEIVSDYKAGVILCYQTTHSLKDCDGGQNGVPPNILNGSSIQWLLVSKGIIYLFPKNINAFTTLGDYLILTPNPQAQSQTLSWTFSGAALRKAYVHN